MTNTEKRVEAQLLKRNAFIGELCVWLYENKTSLSSKMYVHDYGGMPKRLSDQLSLDVVDCISDHLVDLPDMEPEDIVDMFFEWVY